MKIENISRSTKNKNITVELMSHDKIMNIVIPSIDYKEWLYLNGESPSEINMLSFVEEYLTGVITTDDTGQILCEQIIDILGIDKENMTAVHIPMTNYYICKKEYEFCIYNSRHKRISHQELVDIYKFVLFSNYKPSVN